MRLIGLFLILLFPVGLGQSKPPAPLQLPLTCSMTARSIEGGPGTVASGTCPANCSAAVIWGTDTYTDDSPICVAALHAGVVTAGGGPVLITIEAGRESYQGTLRNGIDSAGYGGWERSFSLQAQAAAGGAEAADAAVPSCTPAVAEDTVFVNAAQDYCLSHDSRGKVVENGASSVTIHIPGGGSVESLALNISVTDGAPVGIDLDLVIDNLIEDFFPQQQQFQGVQILERTDATVGGEPAKLLAFGGKLPAGDQLLDVVGHVYVLVGANQKLYSLTFVMDTTNVPVDAYRSTINAMRDSFRITSAGQR